jgi:glucosylceramidase
MLSDPTVRDDIAGIAWHCYAGLEQMSQMQAIDPTASIIMSECSPGVVAYPTAETAIVSLRNYARAVDLWNLALDPSRGGRSSRCPAAPHALGWSPLTSIRGPLR